MELKSFSEMPMSRFISSVKIFPVFGIYNNQPPSLTYGENSPINQSDIFSSTKKNDVPLTSRNCIFCTFIQVTVSLHLNGNFVINNSFVSVHLYKIEVSIKRRIAALRQQPLITKFNIDGRERNFCAKKTRKLRFNFSLSLFKNPKAFVYAIAILQY